MAEGAFADRENGPAVKPGELAKSELWARINSNDPDEVMPPAESHKTLTDAEKQIAAPVDRAGGEVPEALVVRADPQGRPAARRITPTGGDATRSTRSSSPACERKG